jgi:membrane protease YdiL (CAAX protease family)
MTNRKGVIAYLILAFGIAWVAWEVPIRMLGVSPTAPIFQLYALPGAFAPAIAAVLVRLFGGEGFKDARLKLPLFSKWPYFLFALVLPYFVVAAIVVEAEQWGVARADFSLPLIAKALATKGVTGLSSSSLVAILCTQLLVSSVIATPILWGEEFGWRGYLQPRLFAGKPVASAVATGLIWGVWHYPLIFRGYDFGDQAALGSVVFLGGTILLSFIFGWLVERTGSIWSSSLAHAATNAIGGSLTLLLLGGAKQAAMTAYVGALGLPPLLLICLVLAALGRGRSRASAGAEAEA